MSIQRLPPLGVGGPIGVPNSAAVLWQAFLNKIGLRQDLPLTLAQTVVPVAIIDSEISIPVSLSTPALGSPFTQGVIVAPAAGTLLADTGALNAGTSSWFIVASAVGSLDWGNLEVVRRNAANNADIWSQLCWSLQALWRISVVANERIIVRNHSAGNAGIAYEASIWGPF